MICHFTASYDIGCVVALWKAQVSLIWYPDRLVEVCALVFLGCAMSSWKLLWHRINIHLAYFKLFDFLFELILFTFFRCKLFYKKEKEFVEKGLGMLHLKKVENNTKTQMVVRAETNLGKLKMKACRIWIQVWTFLYSCDQNSTYGY